MINLGLAGKQRPERYHPPDGPSDPIDAFLLAMNNYGLSPDSIEPGGKLVRFDIEKRSDKAGWYVFYHGDICAGAFGNWKTGMKETWCSKERHTMTGEESERCQQMIADARKRRKAEEKRLHEAAKIRANTTWSEAAPASPDHPYLLKKKIPAHNLKESRGSLVVPVMDAAGIIWNLQFIKPDGTKRFLSGGRKKGLSFTIPGDGRLFIGEGFSTMASIHAATGGTCIIAFDAGNLPPVAKIVRNKCPTSQITITADNDRFKPPNAGLKFGEEAAKACGGTLVFPNFDNLPGGDDPTLKLTDFNDLAATAGLDAVIMQISTPGQKVKLPPLKAENTAVKERLKARPKPLKFLFKYNDQGLIPKGVVGVLTATGGTGKTFFLLSLAMAGARGGNFGPINAARPVNTLVIVGEDTQDELDRRLWDIARGEFPPALHAASVYGEVGPLMRLDGSTPVLADAYYWLEETIKGHPDLELLIFDPKSRFYGLDENNNDHATQWIQCLESLSKRYDLTILFSHHTGKSSSANISQGMSRGASAIVDGCRWQAGLIRMNKETADRFGVENPRQYILFDTPKSNYGADLPGIVIFKRGENGVLEYVNPEADHLENMADALLELLRLDPEQYTRNELIKMPKGAEIAKELKEIFPAFVRSKDMNHIINFLLKRRDLSIELVNPGRNAKEVIVFSSSTH